MTNPSVGNSMDAFGYVGLKMTISAIEENFFRYSLKSEGSDSLSLLSVSSRSQGNETRYGINKNMKNPSSEM